MAVIKSICTLLAFGALLAATSCSRSKPPVEPTWTPPASAAAFEQSEKVHLAAARAKIAELLAVTEQRNPENTLRLLDEAWLHLEAAGDAASLMENVHPDKAVRDVATKSTQEVSTLAQEITLNPEVYQAIGAIDAGAADGATKHYLEKTLRDLRLQGVDQDEATRTKLKGLREELVKLEQEFQRNINSDNTTVVVRDKAELAGLPADFIAGLKPGKDGGFVLGTDYTFTQPVLQYASSEALRKRMYLAWRNKAYPENIPLLQQILAKRQEVADLLGYTNWAAYVTADKMVGSAERANNFVDQMLRMSKEIASKEAVDLLAVAKTEHPETTAIQEWSSSYYAEQVKRTRYAFDSQEARVYFPYERVKGGVFDITGKLFGVSYRKVEGAPAWHPSVEVYDLIEDGNVIGRFYLDMHPRPDKYNHAAQFGIRSGLRDRRLPEAALVCNFPEPKDGEPALLTYNDVETFFHEFGHLLHTLLAGRQDWVGVSGIKTEWDFVEAPSQMLEEWVADPKLLQSFAKHYQSDEAIPAELVEKIRRSERFGRGLWASRQAIYAAISLRLHQQTEHPVDTDAVVKGILREASPFPVPEEMHFESNFGHLTGYSAIYYTYLWSLTISKDLFSAFDKDNLLDPKVAKKYRDTVLAPGGSKPADQLIRDFLGRDFTLKPFAAWLAEGQDDGAAGE